MTSPCAYPYAARSPYAAPHAYPYAAPSPYAAPYAYPYAAASAYPQAAAYDDPSYYANPLDDVEDPAVEAFLNRYLDGQSSEDEEEDEDVAYDSPVFDDEDIGPLSLEYFSEEPEDSVVPGSPSCYGPGYSRRRCREISDEEGEEESAAKRSLLRRGNGGPRTAIRIESAMDGLIILLDHQSNICPSSLPLHNWTK
ncbi:hypothetical protein KUCAC02_021928 [Chaenocephalus aceratus]|uniref:Uncharacterized protein n=1 Tax=Chaenocephalus aceratus TaxID=36190 RepID=A0ACB9XJ70_CHAAC|nr:hypothetical protein KUCAC02_021928 [Chaenocephalus aceratus]